MSLFDSGELNNTGDTMDDGTYFDNDTEWTPPTYLTVTSISDQEIHSMKVVSLLLHTVTVVLGIPGNAFVIWIAGLKIKKKVTTIWFVNLAVADLLCCLVIPFLMAVIVLDHQWPYGAAMCKVLPTVFIFNMFASVFTLTLITLDRFILVIWPIWAREHRTISRAGLLCGLAWLLALLLSLPQLIYNDIDDPVSVTCLYGDVDRSRPSRQDSVWLPRPLAGHDCLLPAHRQKVERQAYQVPAGCADDGSSGDGVLRMLDAVSYRGSGDGVCGRELI